MEPVAGVADIVQQFFLQTAVAQKVGSWAQIPSNLSEDSLTPRCVTSLHRHTFI